METPKLLWLKENLPESLGARARGFFDLPDFLTLARDGVRHALAVLHGVQMDLSGP